MRQRSITVLIACVGIVSSCGTPARGPIARPTSSRGTRPPPPPVPRPAGPPVAEMRPVTHTYHGTDVVDPYEWLENSADPQVAAWSKGQNAHARRVLDALPVRPAIEARVRAILTHPTRRFGGLRVRGNKVFAMVTQPPREQPYIAVMEGVDAPDTARVVVDPAAIDPSGGTSIDWYDPSPDGTKLAVSLSRGGSERGDLHVFDVATGTDTGDVIERVNGGTAGGDVAWAPDGQGIYYTRYPRPGERPAEDENFYLQVYFHALGQPVAQDRYEIGRDFPRIAEIRLDADDATGRVLATVQNGDGGEFALYVRMANGRWQTVAVFADRVMQGAFGPHGDLFVVSRQNAPRGKILRLRGTDYRLARATTLVPEAPESISLSFFEPPTLNVTATSIYVVYQLGGPSELRVFDLNGRPKPRPSLPEVSSIGATVPLRGDDVLVSRSSYTEPRAWYELTAAENRTRRTGLFDTSLVDGSGWQVRRELATSRDGTQVPFNVIMPPGIELDGNNPCLVYGYGGYGVNEEPGFWALGSLLTEHGIIWVDTNLRGGGEFGEAWHQQGMLTNKQNVFDDFAAVLQQLVTRRYTSPEHIVTMGGSNGGLLMGAMIAQHPTMMRAVVSYVGIYDMLRVELSSNGAFNVTEFGTVTNPDHFRALYAYSPYHHVPEVALPATLLLTGANDPRVEPWHSRKMTARMQAATRGDAPILLRTSDTSGHGQGTALSEEVAQETDAFAFVFSQLGVPFPATPTVRR